MNITLEKIDNLRERANVSYKEAKEALEANDGNMIDAIIYLEGENKTVPDRAKKVNQRTAERQKAYEKKEQIKSTADDFLDTCKKVLKNLNETRVIMYNSERVVVDISLTITILLAAFAFPLTLAIFIIGLVLGNKFKVVRKDKKADVVNNVLNKAAKMTQDVADNLKEKVKVVNQEVNEEE